MVTMANGIKEGFSKFCGFLKDSYERMTDWDEVSKRFYEDPYDDMGMDFGGPFLMTGYEEIEKLEERKDE